jgi:hypothetical protein
LQSDGFASTIKGDLTLLGLLDSVRGYLKHQSKVAKSRPSQSAP